MVSVARDGSSSNNRLLKVIVEFCDFFGVSYPQSNDLGIWWKQVLKEMDKSWIEFLIENFQDYGNSILMKMKQMLVRRSRELSLTEGERQS